MRSQSSSEDSLGREVALAVLATRAHCQEVIRLATEANDAEELITALMDQFQWSRLYAQTAANMQFLGLAREKVEAARLIAATS